MSSVFEHDATPTWSGFIYQGHVAVYLAVCRICELLANGLDKEIIGLTYHLEVENWEDISIFREDAKGKCYLSIHQVKDRKEKNINDYKNPLIQLMLEKGFIEKRNLGSPEAYLHTSREIREDEKCIAQELQTWKENIKEYYRELGKFVEKCEGKINEETFRAQVSEEIKKQPIGLNRKEYKDLLENIRKDIKDKCELYELKKHINELLQYLERDLGIDNINDNVKLYKYEKQKLYCNVQEIYVKIVEQIKKYKDFDKFEEKLTKEQYEYIADKLMNYMRKHISERHQLMMENKKYQRQFSFQPIIRILDESISEYETNANILALRRIYEEALSQYCQIICKNECDNIKEQKCKLLNLDYSKINLNDEEFKRLCFSYNPNCNKKINDRSCLSDLLSKPGLYSSVFEVMRKIPEGYFIIENNRTRTVLKDQKNNAFLTAIADDNSEVAVNSIVEGINTNAEMVSPVFEADELITVHLHSNNDEIWNNGYSEISEKYISQKALKSSDDSRNSICIPKKPRFVKADEVIERLINNKYKEDTGENNYA